MPVRQKSSAPKSNPAAQDRFANVNGVRLHYLIVGTGDPVVLLHGYAETSHMWRPLMSKLAEDPHCHSPRSARSRSVVHAGYGYTKAEMAQDIHALCANSATSASGLSGTTSG